MKTLKTIFAALCFFCTLISCQKNNQPSQETYKVTVARCDDGTLAVDKTEVSRGETVTITATPDTGYELEDISAFKTGVPDVMVKLDENTFKMPGYDVTVSATFVKSAPPAPTTYSVAVTTPVNGTLSVSKTTAAAGEIVEITATPDIFYELEKVSVTKTDAPTTAVTVTSNCFVMPAFNVTVAATFRESAGPGPDFVKKTFTTAVENIVSSDANDNAAIFSAWKKGFKLSVSNSIPSETIEVEKSGYIVADSDGATASLTGFVYKDLAKYVAVYPYSRITNWNKSASAKGYNAATSNLKGNQTATSPVVEFKLSNTINGVNYYIDPETVYLGGSTSEAEPDKLTFRHLMAYIKFTIPQGYQSKIKQIHVWDSAAKPDDSITPTGTDAAHQIAGSCNLQGDSNWAVGALASKNVMHCVNPANDEGSRTRLEPGVYFITVLPKVSSDQSKNYSGLNLQFQNTDKSGAKKILRLETPGKVEPGHVYDLGVLPEMEELGK